MIKNVKDYQEIILNDNVPAVVMEMSSQSANGTVWRFSLRKYKDNTTDD